MGITAGLYVVPADEFAPREGGAVKPRLPRDGVWFDLDKGWFEFDLVLRGMGPPLDRALGGDVWPEGRMDEDNGSDDATWLGFVSPPTVAAVAAALEGLDAGEMLRRLREAGALRADDPEGNYYAECFEQLRQAYRTAAGVGAGLGVLLC
jgi:hypothetical protein